MLPRQSTRTTTNYQDFDNFLLNRSVLKLSLKLDETLEFEEESIKKARRPKKFVGCYTVRPDKKFSISSNFMDAFNTLSTQEKIDHYCKTVQFLEYYFSHEGNNQNYQNTARSSFKATPRQITNVIEGLTIQKYDAYLKGGAYGRKWTPCSIQINPQECRARVLGSENSTIDLHNYLLRSSQNTEKHAFALEATKPNLEKTLRVGFDNQSKYKQCREFVENVLHHALRQNIEHEIRAHKNLGSDGYIKKTSIRPSYTKTNSMEGVRMFEQMQEVDSLHLDNNPLESNRSIAPLRMESVNPIKETTVEKTNTAQKNYTLNFQKNSKPITFNNSNNDVGSPTNGRDHYKQHNTSINHNNTSAVNKTLVDQLMDQGEPSVLQRIEQENEILDNLKDIKKGKQPSYVARPEYENVEVITRKKNINIFHRLLPDFELDDLYDFKDFVQIKNDSSYKIFQSRSESRIFKMTTNISTPVRNVIALISDPANHRHWNPQIQLGNIKIAIESENSIIAYQKNLAYSKFYYPRDFLFVRHLLYRRQNNTQYMVDKSLEHSNYPPFGSITRGEIEYSLWGFQEHDRGKSTKLTMMVHMKHKGNLGVDKQNELTVRYLEGTARLAGYVSRNRSQIQRKECVFDLNWDISQNDENMVYEHMRKQAQEDLFNENLCSEIGSQDFYTTNGHGGWADARQDEGSKMIQKSGFFEISHPKQNKDSLKMLKRPSQTQDAYANSFGNIKNTFSSIDRIISQNSLEGNKKSDSKNILPVQSSNVFPNVSAAPNLLSSQVSEVKERIIMRKKNSSKEQEPVVVKVEIEEPKETNIILEIVCELDKDGYVILPQHYIRRRHKVQPIDKPVINYMKGKNWDHYLWRDLWAQSSTGELKCINQAKLRDQSKVLSFVLKKFATNLLTGKNILNMSLPVEIFSQLSVLQLMARSFCLCPVFMERAAQKAQALQRMKLTISFALTYSLLYLEMQKPFNPILGETYQGWINGCPFFGQQISHHPPISTCYFAGRGYKIYASTEPKIDLSANSGVGINEGELHVVFDKFPNEKIRFQGPGGQIVGLAFGDRKFGFTGIGHFYDTHNNLYAELIFNPGKKGMLSWGKQTRPADAMEGKIYHVHPGFFERIGRLKKREGPKTEEVKQVLSNMSGRWTQHLLFDDVEYFNVNREKPFALQQEKFPLCSNSNFREDVIYRRKQDYARAQVEKERLQNLQRADRKLREKKHGKKH